MLSRSYSKECVSSLTRKGTQSISVSTGSPWLRLLSSIGMRRWPGSMIELITESRESFAVRSATMSKPSRKVSIRMPTHEEDEKITQAAANDPDALPLAEEQMNLMVPLKTLRGRPRLTNKKQLVSIRYGPEVLEYFRSSGAGWQSRMDEVLKKYVESRSISDAKGA